MRFNFAKEGRPVARGTPGFARPFAGFDPPSQVLLRGLRVAPRRLAAPADDARRGEAAPPRGSAPLRGPSPRDEQGPSAAEVDSWEIRNQAGEPKVTHPTIKHLSLQISCTMYRKNVFECHGTVIGTF